MGKCSSSPKKRNENQELYKVCIDDFELKYILGEGGFGKVWKVVYQCNGENYAMKVMSKKIIALKRNIRSVMNERKLLSFLRNEFIINMKWAFQDRDNLYLVMDQLTGGDLELHLQKFQFTQYQTQFIIACLIIALEYLRTKNIIHRDIKPQNIVFDSSGYIRLTDFGVSKVNKIDNACDTSGTANYMAPEVLCKQNHSFEADYYAIGVIVYEFMFRRKPIIAVDKKELRKKVLDQQISIKKNEVPEGWSIEAADFINQLLQRKPTKRIGYGGIEELKQHPWFDGFEWDLLRKKQLQPLYIPQPITEHNRKPSPYIEPEVQGLDNLLYDDFIQRQFSGYTFANDIDQEDEEQEAYIHPAQQQQKERKYMATIAEE